MGLLRIVMLFGSGAIALGLLVAPFAERHTRHWGETAGLPAGLDLTSTGSVDRTQRYVLRRSVLQETPDSVCKLHENGMRSGQC